MAQWGLSLLDSMPGQSGLVRHIFQKAGKNVSVQKQGILLKSVQVLNMI